MITYSHYPSISVKQNTWLFQMFFRSLDTLNYNKIDLHRVILNHDFTNNRLIKVHWFFRVFYQRNWINYFDFNTLTVLKSNNSTLFWSLFIYDSFYLKYIMANLNKTNYNYFYSRSLYKMFVKSLLMKLSMYNINLNRTDSSIHISLLYFLSYICLWISSKKRFIYHKHYFISNM